MILERDIEAALKRRVEHCGGKCIKFVAVSESGIPDRIVILPRGRVIFVELKRPRGGKIAPIQKYQMEKLRSLGCEAVLVKNYSDIEKLLEEQENDKDREHFDRGHASGRERNAESEEQLGAQ